MLGLLTPVRPNNEHSRKISGLSVLISLILVKDRNFFFDMINESDKGDE